MSTHGYFSHTHTGTMRVFEMQRKNGRGFLRFPLYPGSLLLMEGATQEDWEHQVMTTIFGKVVGGICDKIGE